MVIKLIPVGGFMPNKDFLVRVLWPFSSKAAVDPGKHKALKKETTNMCPKKLRNATFVNRFSITNPKPNVWYMKPGSPTTICFKWWFLFDDDKSLVEKLLFINQPIKNDGQGLPGLILIVHHIRGICGMVSDSTTFHRLPTEEFKRKNADI